MKKLLAPLACLLYLAGILVYRTTAQSPAPATSRTERFRTMSEQAEKKGLAEPFRGITTNGTPAPGLFTIKSTGVSTEPVRKAAASFLTGLSAEQRAKTSFGLEDPEWQKWMNQHFYIRQGMSFKDMNEAQRESAFALMKASLSAKGLKLSRDIMRLNHTLGELNNNNFEEYGEWLYWITVMGEPSSKEPWGWQLDGHHLIVNYFVLGDQVVMTPLFVGSEPVIAHEGKFKGTAILQDEQRLGLSFIKNLPEAQRNKAILNTSKTGNNNLTEAWKDNVVLDYAGAKAADFTAAQKDSLLQLINMYISNMDDGHAKVKMSEVRKHLDNTWFAWIGGTDADSVFYYRIHSPVLLIEFDHQNPAGLRHMFPGPPKPNKEHVHAVVRTPNGNDYGKDLLRQHYEQHPHPHR
ncbi:MAG TPA: DUF3500 domain-containing protein [Bryobacteraceae bacterium]|nr:DUF3500 domain-containing protein [Bryobacteraceae bacterium]